MKRPSLVVDASAAVHLVTAEAALAGLDRYDLVAPHLLWSEALSALCEAAWRGILPPHAAASARARLEALSIEPRGGPELRAKAWSMAGRLGWAKTYDAEYVALAELLGAELLTVDARLQRGVGAVIRTIEPGALA